MDDVRWNSLRKRLISEADEVLKNNRHGVCVARVYVALDREGRPIIWTLRESLRIEPSTDAKTILLALLGEEED